MIFRSECGATRSVFADAVPATATSAAANASFSKRYAMTPPLAPCGARAPAQRSRLVGRRRAAPAGKHASGLALLLDVPEHRRRRGRNAVDVLARRGWLIPLTQEQVRRVFGVALLRGRGDF